MSRSRTEAMARRATAHPGEARALALAVAGVVAGLGSAAQAWAYGTYRWGCGTCHGDFLAAPYRALGDGTEWPGSLHDVHRDDMLSGDCDACHLRDSWTPVGIPRSNGGAGLAPVSCLGCHESRGLRQRHAVVGGNPCARCHHIVAAGKETDLPPYYADPGEGHPNIPVDPCNPYGSEQFGGGPEGLDNDGDGLYDQDDPDCPPPGPRCGNGIVDAAAGEVCDDGNRADGDGCASDCRSDERCGNGIVDEAAGEVCDDGNRQDGDGCSSGCRLEAPASEGCGCGAAGAGTREDAVPLLLLALGVLAWGARGRLVRADPRPRRWRR